MCILEIRMKTVLFLILLYTLFLYGTATCGNGYLETGEQCDDGNLLSGDGCTPTCTLQNTTLFICTNMAITGGGQITKCCLALINPVTNARVCNCEKQASGTSRYTISSTCTKVDVDECATVNGGCAANAVCQNVDGTTQNPGYTCVCPTGLFGDGYSRCDTRHYAVELALKVENVTQNGNHLAESWFVGKLSGLFQSVLSVSVKYIVNRRRRLLTTYDHVAVSFEVASWDTMQSLVDTINADSVAAFLSQQTGGMNLISVLQSTTTAVVESPSLYTYSSTGAPGFLLENISYAAVPIGQWSASEYVWRLRARFYVPPNTYAALYITEGHAGYAPQSHRCVMARDVCCLSRTNSDHLMGAFGAYVASTITPYCTAMGGFPDALYADRPSNDWLSSLSQNVWVTGLTDGLQNSDVTLVDSSHVTIDLSQADIANTIAHAEPFAGGFRYSFAVGFLFFNTMGIPAIDATVGQTKLEIYSTGTVSFVAASQQSYTFLEYLDVALYELEYQGHALQWARVTMLLPSDMTATTLVPGSSLQFAQGSNTLQAGSWLNPCYSSDNATLRDGSGRWDNATGATRVLFQTATQLDCALPASYFCAAAEATNNMYTIDIPLGDDILSQDYLFLRFAITAQKDTFEMLTQADAQVLISDTTIIRLCSEPLTSELDETAYTSISLAIGMQLAPIAGDERNAVVFTDITHSIPYETLKALDTAETYQAVSVLDSLLSVAILGESTFFEPTIKTVQFDQIITMHFRSDLRFNMVMTLIANQTAYTTTKSASGIYSIQLAQEVRTACYSPALIQDPTPDGTLECAIQYPISNRVVNNKLAHVVASTTTADVNWFVSLFGDSPFMREKGLEFAQRVRTQFSLNSRYKRAAWVLPTYAWPDANTIDTTDRTIMLLAYSVA